MMLMQVCFLLHGHKCLVAVWRNSLFQAEAQYKLHCFRGWTHPSPANLEGQLHAQDRLGGGGKSVLVHRRHANRASLGALSQDLDQQLWLLVYYWFADFILHLIWIWYTGSNVAVLELHLVTHTQCFQGLHGLLTSSGSREFGQPCVCVIVADVLTDFTLHCPALWTRNVWKRDFQETSVTCDSILDDF